MVQHFNISLLQAIACVLLAAHSIGAAGANSKAAASAAAGSGSITVAGHKLELQGIAAEAMFASTINTQLSCKRAGFYWHGNYCSPCPANYYWEDAAGACAPRETTCFVTSY